MDNSLTSSEEIYTYVDSDTLDSHPVTGIESDYVQQRIQKKISKKILMVDSPHAREYMSDANKNFTQIRFLPKSVTQFGVAMEIYDGKVSYLTFHEDAVTGMLIEHPAIYTMHRQLFAARWRELEEKETG